jgi:ABC-2 type transport system ATP-binding protein
MITIKNLTKKYNGKLALSISSLQIEKAECFGLVGNNGAGKTTLFRLILDLIKASTGCVQINEVDVSKSEQWKTLTGSYLDEHMLLSFLTPDEYFETLRKIYDLSADDLNAHLTRFEVLFNDEILGNKKYIRDLSRGNIKKVGIAAALLGEPGIVILDEPFENLDPTSQNRLKKLILAEREEKQTTFLISSHDLSHVTDICSRIVLLENGKIINDLKGEKEVMATTLAEYFDR